MQKMIKKLVPKKIKHEVKNEITRLVIESSQLEANTILAKLYHPVNNPVTYPIFYSIDKQKPIPLSASQQLPIPPSAMRMGYSPHSDKEFLDSGYCSAGSIHKILKSQNIGFESGMAVLDWGCATGRVLRYFAKEAERGEFWGLDQDAASIQWDKENLSPPFHFMTCTAYPHLPFEDNKFDIAYGMSVFTHIYHCYDIWLMEFRRILKKGGYAIFTVIDEYCWEFFHKNWKPDWMPEQDFSKGIPHDMTVYGGTIWGGTFVFVKRDWVRKEWNRYLNVVDIVPGVEGYQTAIILRK